MRQKTIKYTAFLVRRLHHRYQVVRTLLFSERARPLRFLFTGGLAGLIQLGLLDILTHIGGWNAILANVVAFLLAAQVNFLLSALFTWHDRQKSNKLLSRWIAFHSSISGTALLNNFVFVIARGFMPNLAASALGIGVAALVNFIMMNRFVFRKCPIPLMETTYTHYPAYDKDNRDSQ